MPKWVEKILKHIPAEKSLKESFAIYLDLECLLKKEQSHSSNNNNNNIIIKIIITIIIIIIIIIIISKNHIQKKG